MGVKEDETAKVNAIGDKIRDLKKAKAEKEVIMAEVAKLQAAKEAYERAVGEPFPAPAAAPAKKKKKEVGPPSPEKAMSPRTLSSSGARAKGSSLKIRPVTASERRFSSSRDTTSRSTVFAGPGTERSTWQ